MKKNHIIIVVTSILVILTTIFFLTSKFNSKYDLVLSNEFSSSYSSDLKENYKIKQVDFEDYSLYYDKAKAIEIDEYSANALLDAGLGVKFISSYNIKTVLIRNKNKTDTNISSLKELQESDVVLNYHFTNRFYSKQALMSVSYSLTNEFDLDTSIDYFNSFYKNKNLIHKKIDTKNSDYIICASHYAKELVSEDSNLEIIDMAEGALETNIGLLVIDEAFDLSKYNETLNNHNLKIEEYSNTFKCDDYEVYGKLSKDRVRKFRRNILNTYKFSGVNSDERSIILIVVLSLMIPWAIYIGIRINDFEIRKAVIICLGMVLSWLFLRYLRSHLSNDTFLRYVWYLNYLPLIFAPILFLNANMAITLKKSKKRTNITITLFIISIILLFLVLCNDVFEFAFVFKDGLDNWNNYSYGFLFYTICLVGFMELIAGIVLLIKKNYKQTSKKVLASPILIFLFIFTYIALDFIGVSYVTELDYTLIICLFALILWEVTLRAGLVQNCGRYNTLFNNMTFDLAFMTKSDELVIKTKSFNDSDNDSIRSSKYELSNGYAILKDDLEVLDKVKKELEKRTTLLEKNNNTLKHEHKIMAEYYSLTSQNEILNEIDLDYKAKNEEIINLINKIEPLNDKKEIYPYLARIKFLVSYTKQKYNCILNSKMSEKIEIQTIALAIHIIMEDAKSLNIESGLLCNSMELIDSSLGVIILDLFYMMMENALENKSDLFVNIDVNNDYITVFGLFKESSTFNYSYYSNGVKTLIDNKGIEVEIKENDDMLKLIFRIRSVI